MSRQSHFTVLYRAGRRLIIQCFVGRNELVMARFSAILGVSLTATVAACSTVPMPGQLAPGQVTANEPNQEVTPRQDREKPGQHLLQIASDVEARGDREAALQFYERAAMMSDDPLVRIKLGDAYLRAGRSDDALSAYRAALAKAPDDGQALMGVGGALLRAGKLQEGYDALAKAAPLVKTAIAYNRLGVAQVMLGRIPDALTSFEEAHELDRNDADITTNLALAAVVNGHFEQAVVLMRELSEAHSSKMQHKRNLVLVMGIAGRGKEAQESVKGVNAAEMKTLLERAEKIRKLTTPKARAEALSTAAQQAASQ